MNLRMLRTGTALLAAGAALSASAAGFQIRPYAAARAEYNDNKQLLVTDEIGAWGAIAELAAHIEREEQRWGLRVTPKTRLSQFSTAHDFDSEEFFLDVAPSWRGERWSVSGNAFGYRESTLSSELTDSGILFDNTNRDSYGAQAQAGYQLGPRQAISLTLFGTDVNYHDEARTGYVDYRYYQAGGQYSFNLTERLGLFANAYYSKYDAGVINETDSIGAQLGASYDFDEMTAFSVAAGVNRSDTDYQDILTLGDLGAAPPLDTLPALNPDGSFRFIQRQTDSTGFIMRATLVRDYERGTIDFTGERRISPSSRGTQATNTSARLYADYRYDQRLRLYTSLYVLDLNSESDLATGLIDRVYGSARLGVQYRLSRILVLEGRYEYRSQDRDTVGTGSGNIFGIHLSYAPDPYRPFEWFN